MSFIGTYTYDLKNDREITIDVKKNIAKRFRIPTQFGEFDWVQLTYTDSNGEIITEKVEKPLFMACRYLYGLKLTNEFLPFDATKKGVTGVFTITFSRPMECCFRHDIFLHDSTPILSKLTEVKSLMELKGAKFLLIQEDFSNISSCLKIKDRTLTIEYENDECNNYEVKEIFSSKPIYTYLYDIVWDFSKIKCIYFETNDIFENMRVFSVT